MLLFTTSLTQTRARLFASRVYARTRIIPLSPLIFIPRARWRPLINMDYRNAYPRAVALVFGGEVIGFRFLGNTPDA